MTQITNNENGDMIFNPSMLKTLYDRALKQIAELQEDIKNKSNVIIDLTNKVSRRNLQITDLKKQIEDYKKYWIYNPKTV